MKDHQENIAGIWNRFLRNEAGSEELEALLRHIESADKDETFSFMDEQMAAQSPDVLMDAGAKAGMLKKILAAGPLAVQHNEVHADVDAEIPADTKLHRLPVYRRWGWVAAAVVLLLATSTYFLLQPERPLTSPNAGTQLAYDVAAGYNKAILTLSDGSVVPLDSAGDQIIHQGAVAVRQAGGQLVYDAQGSNDAVVYNKLETPRGGQFNIRLPDGTEVWLNAASSLRYPTRFTGKERTVEVNGEAYFEVAKNAAMPFRVKAGNGTSIEVLGTSFNVNVYEEEPGARTTLLEGAVRINAGTKSVVLKPGEQAVANTEIKVTGNADLNKTIAWKNGLFNFEGANLREVMHQLERWYDIDVEYKRDIPDLHFFGEITRNVKLSTVLETLEAYGVHFKLEEGRRLIVSAVQEKK